MSHLPFAYGYNRPFYSSIHPGRHLNQDFDFAFIPNHMTVGPMVSREWLRPWPHMAFADPNIGSSITNDKNMFQVNLDVQHFSPEEIAVKTADGYIVVEGKHEEKKDQHGYISRHFVRRYALPEDCNPDTVVSKLSSDGVLTVTAPRVPSVANNERSIPIQQTGPVQKKVNDANEE